MVPGPECGNSEIEKCAAAEVQCAGFSSFYLRQLEQDSFSFYPVWLKGFTVLSRSVLLSIKHGTDCCSSIKIHTSSVKSCTSILERSSRMCFHLVWVPRNQSVSFFNSQLPSKVWRRGHRRCWKSVAAAVLSELDRTLASNKKQRTALRCFGFTPDWREFS